MTDGLRIEAAASVVARDMITKHLGSGLLSHVISKDRIAGQATAAAYIDGLAGVVALTIAGGHGSKSEVVESTIKALCDAIERDLKHLRRSK